MWALGVRKVVSGLYQSLDIAVFLTKIGCFTYTSASNPLQWWDLCNIAAITINCNIDVRSNVGIPSNMLMSITSGSKSRMLKSEAIKTFGDGKYSLGLIAAVSHSCDNQSKEECSSKWVLEAAEHSSQINPDELMPLNLFYKWNSKIYEAIQALQDLPSLLPCQYSPCCMESHTMVPNQ